MHRDLRVYLWDVLQAGADIKNFVQGLTEAAYLQNAMVQAAVERKFIVIGEALGQARKHFPDIQDRVPELPSVVAFRNHMVHGYFNVNSPAVWTIIEDFLPDLLARLQEIADGETS